MLSVYKGFYQTVKYNWQRNHIFQDLTGLEIEISMKASKTENWFEITENRFTNKTALTSLLYII